MPSTSALPSRCTRSAMRRSCSSNGRSTSISTTTTSAKRIAFSVSATESFSSFSSMRALRRMPAVSNRRNSRPCHSSITAIVSRVMPASGPVSRRSSPSRRLISVDLPTFGRPTTATRIGRSATSVVVVLLLGGRRVIRQRRTDRIVEIGQSLAVLGRNRDRIAEAQFIGLRRARTGAALALVADDDDRLSGAAHDIGEGAIDRRQAAAHIHQEQNRIGAFERESRFAPPCGR